MGWRRLLLLPIALFLARIAAAERDTSVSALVKAYLEKLAEAFAEEELFAAARPLAFGGSGKIHQNEFALTIGEFADGEGELAA